MATLFCFVVWCKDDEFHDKLTVNSNSRLTSAVLLSLLGMSCSTKLWIAVSCSTLQCLELYFPLLRPVWYWQSSSSRYLLVYIEDYYCFFVSHQLTGVVCDGSMLRKQFLNLFTGETLFVGSYQHWMDCWALLLSNILFSGVEALLSMPLLRWQSFSLSEPRLSFSGMLQWLLLYLCLYDDSSGQFPPEFMLYFHSSLRGLCSLSCAGSVVFV